MRVSLRIYVFVLTHGCVSPYAFMYVSLRIYVYALTHKLNTFILIILDICIIVSHLISKQAKTKKYLISKQENNIIFKQEKCLLVSRFLIFVH